MSANAIKGISLPWCSAIALGMTEYTEALALQKRLAEEVAEGFRRNTMLLVEHPHVYTLGQRASTSVPPIRGGDLPYTAVPVLTVDRGGQATYHGPGQIVCYPIVRLKPTFDGPLAFVRRPRERRRGYAGPVRYCRLKREQAHGRLDRRREDRGDWSESEPRGHNARRGTERGHGPVLFSTISCSAGTRMRARRRCRLNCGARCPSQTSSARSRRNWQRHSAGG